MFNGITPSVPAFFEFVSQVYFDGIGYVERVAVDERFAEKDSPACKEYVSTGDGFLFTLQNGACTCVSNANVKFLAGKRVMSTELPADGDKKHKGRVGDMTEKAHAITSAMNKQRGDALFKESEPWNGFASPDTNSQKAPKTVPASKRNKPRSI